MTIEEFLLDYQKIRGRVVKLLWLLFYGVSLAASYRIAFKKGQEDAFAQVMEYVKQQQAAGGAPSAEISPQNG